MNKLLQRYQQAHNPVRSERYVELVLVVLGAILLLQLLWLGMTLLFSGPPATVMPSADALAMPQGHVHEGPTLAQSEDIQQRPLFWISRRPVVIEPEEVKEEEKPEDKAKGQLKQIKMLGIFGGGESGGVIALVKNKKQRVLVGEEVLGWTLASVQPDSAVFERSGQREQLNLVSAKADKT